MNIAIILGVSDYTAITPLPACKNDALTIHDIIKLSGKYEDILFNCGEINSFKYKSDISQFIKKHQNSDIKELFFYYSGHGTFSNEDFSYIFTDYNAKKHAQTSLSNTEIDEFFKSLKPQLAIKTIDACHAGVTYIKDVDSIKECFDNKKSYFNKCYFLFSSLVNQASFATDISSHFTTSLVNSILNSSPGDIRYKDIIDYISDDFADKDQQTPFFVVQADYTEVFLNDTTSLIKALANSGHTPEQEEPKEQTNTSLVDTLERMSISYASKHKTLELFEDIKRHILSTQLPKEMQSIFELEHTLIDQEYEIPNIKSIGNWLFEQKQYNDIYAQVITEEEEYEYENNINYFNISYALPINSMYGNPRTTTRTRTVATGYRSTAQTPYKAITITAKSKYPALPNYACNIVFIISKKNIFIFSGNSFYKEINWDDKTLDTNFKWSAYLKLILNKDDVLTSCSKILEIFFGYIIENTHKKIEKLEVEASTE